MNNTINTTETTPDMYVKVETLPDFSDVIEFKDGIINIINDGLSTIIAGYEIHLIAVVSVLAALVLKKKYDEDWVWWVIVSIMIFSAIRFIGIGG